MNRDGIKAVAAAALEHWEIIASAIDPNYRLSGEEVLLLNPTRDDRNRGSFSFSRLTGVSKDFATCQKGEGDLVGLWKSLKGFASMSSAAEDLSSFLGLNSSVLPGTPIRTRQEAKPPTPVPIEALEGIPRLLARVKATRHATGEHWIIRDIEARALLVRIRCEPPGEKKSVLPFFWCPEDSKWKQGGSFAPLLYGMERLRAAPGATVLLVEGEKTADAAQTYFPHLVVLGFLGAGTVRQVAVEPLLDRDVIVWPDADKDGIDAARTLAARIAQAGGRVRLVDLPDPLKAWVKPGKTEPGGWDLADPAPAGIDLNAFLNAAAAVDLSQRPESNSESGHSGLPDRAGCYLIHEGRMCMENSEGARRTLCGFVARIREELVLDDGEAEDLFFLVEGRLPNGEHLPTARVPATSFANLGWIMSQWGARPIVNAGTNTKDQLRAAIQHLSTPVRRRAFLNIGWRNLEGRWYYLHAAGALGPDGPVGSLNVDLKDRLALYTLGEPLQGAALTQAFRSSQRTLDLGPGAVTAAVWLAAFRAVVDESPFSVHISGSKGEGKTELASISAGHFGPALQGKKPLECWESTTAALERSLFLAKDAIGVVDDFRPGESTKEQHEMTRKADRLLRGAFNRASRSRLASDAKTQRNAYWARGLIMSTGEDLPGGESLRSRVLMLEWAAGDMRWNILTDLQKDRTAGLHAGLMASFIMWQAKDRERAQKLRREAHADARQKLWASGENNRTGDIAADLWSAWPVLEAFARECHILPPAELEALGRRLWACILKMTGAQSSIISEANPAERFREGLTACLASGRGHLAHGDPGDLPEEWLTSCGWHDGQPKGIRLGFLSPKKAEVWLIPSAAYQEVSRMVALGVGERALWKRIQEAGWLSLERDKRLKVRRTLPGGGRPDFIAIHMAHLWIMGNSELEDEVEMGTWGQTEKLCVPA